MHAGVVSYWVVLLVAEEQMHNIETSVRIMLNRDGPLFLIVLHSSEQDNWLLFCLTERLQHHLPFSRHFPPSSMIILPAQCVSGDRR
jgi:hypothetical protein